MRPLKILLLIAAFLCALGASRATADTLTHTFTVDSQFTDWTSTGTVPQFDRRLGTLQSVTLSVQSDGLATAAILSRDPGWRWGVYLSTTNTVAATANGLQASDTVSAEYSGPLQYDVWLTVDFPIAVGGSATTDQNLPAWVGRGVVPVQTSATARTLYRGPGSFSLGWQTRASAAVTVVYTYAPKQRCDDDDDDDDRERKSRKRRK